MYIAINRFKVILGSEREFEDVWRNRPRRLADLPGFKAFHLLRGPETEEYTLFASHTIWESYQHFVDWTKSQNFRDAHANAGKYKANYIEGPQFEGFDVVLDY